jgi:hypothetical protein
MSARFALQVVGGAPRILELAGRAQATMRLVSSDGNDAWQSIGTLARRVVARIEKPRG